MMFRKLYWVTEQLQNGSTSVTGVYTSVHDLIKSGLRWHGERTPDTSLRLSLVKLDSGNGPLGQWHAGNLATLGSDLEPFVRTDEFRHEEVYDLAEALGKFLDSPKV